MVRIRKNKTANKLKRKSITKRKRTNKQKHTKKYGGKNQATKRMYSEITQSPSESDNERQENVGQTLNQPPQYLPDLSNIHPKCLDDERGILARSYRSNPSRPKRLNSFQQAVSARAKEQPNTCSQLLCR